jgi:glycosyltransferase involved in cell wall biosynthesis
MKVDIVIRNLSEKRPSHLSLRQKWSLRLRIHARSLKEHLKYDAVALRRMVGFVGCLWGSLLYWVGFRKKGFAILSTIHRSAILDWGNRRVEQLVRCAAQASRQGKPHSLFQVYDQYVQETSPTDHTRRFFQSPEKMLNGNVIVLKSPSAGEKGVILLYYSYTYQCFAKLFNLDAIMERYYLILEPSWSGLCDLAVLFFTRKKQPVFVGSIEPRDAAFVKALESNLVPVYFGNNTWVDHRVFRPLPGVQKDLDIIMVAAWGGYKRHWAFFSALRKLHRRGFRPKVALAGYPLGDTLEDLRDQAELFGVEELLEIHEFIGPEEVNRLYNRAKVNVLWSRREGSPRAIIEGMFAGIPCIIREGFNFGDKYPHINDQTGRFASEASLADTLLEMIERYELYSPRAWAMEHMSCQRSTARLNQAIREKAVEAGEVWTKDLVVKTNELNGLRYWSINDGALFRADHEFLRSMIVRQD